MDLRPSAGVLQGTLRPPQLRGRRAPDPLPRLGSPVPAPQLDNPPDTQKGRAGRWFRMGTWAVGEQGLSSLAFLAVHIGVGRWTDPVSYGEFAISFAVFVLLEITFRSLFGEPALVFASRYRGAISRYFRLLLAGAVVVATGASVVLLVLSGLVLQLGQRGFGLAFGGLAVGTVPLLLASLLRRLCYARLRPSVAVFAGSANVVVVLTGLWILQGRGLLSPLSAYLLLGIGALVLNAVAAMRLDLRATSDPSSLTAKEVMKAHWTFARSAIPSALLSWIPVHVYYVFLPLLPSVNRDISGQLRAAVTLIMPLLQVNGAIGTLLVATFSTRRAAGQRLGQARFGWVLASISGAYWLILLAAGAGLMHFVYGPAFEMAAAILPVLGALPILTALAHVLRSVALSGNRPDIVLRSQVVAAGLAISVGLALAWQWLLAGAAYGMLFAVLGQIAMLAWSLRHDSVGRVTAPEPGGRLRASPPSPGRDG